MKSLLSHIRSCDCACCEDLKAGKFIKHPWQLCGGLYAHGVSHYYNDPHQLSDEARCLIKMKKKGFFLRKDFRPQ